MNDAQCEAEALALKNGEILVADIRCNTLRAASVPERIEKLEGFARPGTDAILVAGTSTPKLHKLDDKRLEKPYGYPGFPYLSTLVGINQW